jgi:hypothetical protein
VVQAIYYAQGVDINEGGWGKVDHDVGAVKSGVRASRSGLSRVEEEFNAYY